VGDRELKLEDRGDYVAVGLEGDEITRCYVDYQFSLLFGDTGALVVIETPFSILGEDGEQRFDPEKWAGLGPALEDLLFKKVTAAKAHKNGELEITLPNDVALRVLPNADYESWHVVAGGTSAERARIVSMPGGKLAIWGTGISASNPE
jgi:Family of unknown function (DUF6188)